ncbi:phosphatidylinositol triP phosphatase-like protein, partial [Leptotrombidium deliense]
YKKFSDELPSYNGTASKTPVLTTDHKNVDLNNRKASMNGTEMEEVKINIVDGKTVQEEFPEYNETDVPFREKVRRKVEHIIFRLFTVVLIITDCILLIVDIAIVDKPNEQEIFDILALSFVSFFVLEVCVRIYAHTPQAFFKNIYNTIDFIIIAISFALNVIAFIVDIAGPAKLFVLGRIIRVIVLIRLIRVFYTEPHNIRKGARNVVSENKRRYRDGEFDIDLTYVTKNVLAMSFPSSGRMAVYRNNIKEVAKFFDTRHGSEHFKVYNMCSEKGYDTSYFHGRVGRYPIDDHNVPTLQQMLDFVRDVENFLNAHENNVIAVHCKGGKGRTGTMICAWLVYSGQFSTAQEALDFFADQRTDKTVSDKFQGVETPSQSRYVEYFTTVVNELNAEIPLKVELNLLEIKIHGIKTVGNGDGSDLNCQIQIDRKTVFNLDFHYCTNCVIKQDIEKDVLSVTPRNCPPLIGDVRLKFNSRNKSVPKAYEKCAFYFWFNTSFIEKNSNSLRIHRNDLDNPHKQKTWNIYGDNFAVELFFKRN